MIDQKNSTGIVTLFNWTMMPNEEKYLYVWCKEWKVITDREVPVENFHSSEKWQLLGIVNEEIVCIIPGCQVKAWVRRSSPPDRLETFVFK